jgi:hypothetical protein
MTSGYAVRGRCNLGEPCRIRAGSGSFQVLDLTLLLHLSEQAAGAANQHVYEW